MSDLCIVGLALPYNVRSHFEQTTTERDGAQQTVPAHSVSFYNGCCSVAILRKQIRLGLNHTPPDDFPSQAAGTLEVFENCYGTYLRGTLPDTPLGHATFAAIAAKKIRNICLRSSETETEQDGDTVVVRRCDAFEATLLLAAPAHSEESWIWPAGPLAEERIALEVELAQFHHWWALEPELLAEDTCQPLKARFRRRTPMGSGEEPEPPASVPRLSSASRPSDGKWPG